MTLFIEISGFKNRYFTLSIFYLSSKYRTRQLLQLIVCYKRESEATIAWISEETWPIINLLARALILLRGQWSTWLFPFSFMCSVIFYHDYKIGKPFINKHAGNNLKEKLQGVILVFSSKLTSLRHCQKFINGICDRYGWSKYMCALVNHIDECFFF